jgi:PAS domain S-box-containing protein
MRLVEELSEDVLASVLLLDEDGLHLRHGAAPSLPDAYTAAVDGIAVGPKVGSCATAAYRREPVVVSDIASDPLWAELRELALGHGLRACWSTPLLGSGGDVLGTFAMYYREPRQPTGADFELGEVARHLARIAIERARQEQRLVKAEEKYRRLVEQLPLAVYAFTPVDRGTDLRGLARYVSPQVEAMLGYSPDEWRNDPDLYTAIVHPEDRDRVAAEVHRARALGDRFRSEYRMVGKDGRVVWVHDESVYLRDEEGRLMRVEGFLLDVSERKALESGLLQAQKMEAVGRLAGGIAHDFNNLMSAVVGFGELVYSRLDEESPLRAQVEQIVRAGERASAMTNQLLAFSRKQVLQARVLDLNAVVADSEKLLRRLIGEDVELTCVLGPELEPVEADPVQLEQVIVNLAVNARDAMPRGGKLTIETANVEVDREYASSHFGVETGPYVLLSVSDTGVGMDADTRARAFEPFFTTKGEGEGTGLGLATVFGIVKQSGGHVAVYSEPGRGTTFKVYLPRAEDHAQRSERPNIRLTLPRGSETILLVEDEELVRNLERQVLQECGYTVLEARDPRQAFEIAADHEGPIDLLLTDVVMPGCSGRELAERLTPTRPEMKVLYSSGYADDAVVRHGVLEAEVAFLPKPLTPASVAAKAREVLDSRPAVALAL